MTLACLKKQNLDFPGSISMNVGSDIHCRAEIQTAYPTNTTYSSTALTLHHSARVWTGDQLVLGQHTSVHFHIQLGFKHVVTEFRRPKPKRSIV
jgi:hypothetical protein